MLNLSFLALSIDQVASTKWTTTLQSASMYTFHCTVLAHGARKPDSEWGKMGSNALNSTTDRNEQKMASGLLLLACWKEMKNSLLWDRECRLTEFVSSSSAKVMEAYARAIQTVDVKTCFLEPTNCISQYVLYLRHMGVIPKYIMFYIKNWVEFYVTFQCFLWTIFTHNQVLLRSLVLLPLHRMFQVSLMCPLH